MTTAPRRTGCECENVKTGAAKSRACVISVPPVRQSGLTATVMPAVIPGYSFSSTS